MRLLRLRTGALALELEQVDTGLQQVLAVTAIRGAGRVDIGGLGAIRQYPNLDATLCDADQHVAPDRPRHEKGRNDQKLLADPPIENLLEPLGQVRAPGGLAETLGRVIDHQMRARPDERQLTAGEVARERTVAHRPCVPLGSGCTARMLSERGEPRA